jgi:hypothetical protein
VVGAPPTHPVMPKGPGCALGNEPPAARGPGGCQVVGAGPHPPGLGRNWALDPNRSPGGLVGPRAQGPGRVRCGAAGGVAAASQGYLLGT